ncbi:MAG: hypothetical protein GY703_14765 [Gammaproteobacteria bacterium]|nr:hypothetical protein [Gammaproteobacteria bacterium]
MKTLIIAGLHLTVALLPLLGSEDRKVEPQPGFKGWPVVYQGKSLIPLSADGNEARFSKSFPGQLGRFTDGEKELVFRYLEQPSRQLHGAADCYKGAGYDVNPLALQRNRKGELMGCIRAERDGRTVRVCERVYDGDGNSWYDVSSWYWAAILKRSTGPWWAVTVAEPL